MTKPKTPENVIWICENGHAIKNTLFVRPDHKCVVFESEIQDAPGYNVQCLKNFNPYIPQANYLELENKLKIAQEALIRTRFLSAPINLGAYDIARIFHVAEEALSKLQTKDSEGVE